MYSQLDLLSCTVCICLDVYSCDDQSLSLIKCCKCQQQLIAILLVVAMSCSYICIAIYVQLYVYEGSTFDRPSLLCTLVFDKINKFSKSNEYYMHAWTHAYYLIITSNSDFIQCKSSFARMALRQDKSSITGCTQTSYLSI